MNHKLIPPLWKRQRINERFGITKNVENKPKGRKKAKYYIITKGDQRIKCNNQKEIVEKTGATIKTVMNRCSSGQTIKGWLIERIFEDDQNEQD